MMCVAKMHPNAFAVATGDLSNFFERNGFATGRKPAIILLELIKNLLVDFRYLNSRAILKYIQSNT